MLHASPAELTLVDTQDEIVIRPESPSYRSPVLCKSWDPGAPAIREAGMYDRTGMDGSWDASSYTGARTVTMELTILGDQGSSAYEYAERLAAMTHPGRRPFLYVRRSQEHSGEDWRIGLRGTPFSLAYGMKAAAMLEMTLSFAAQDGYFESPLREAYSSGGVTGDSPGFILGGQVFPMTFGSGGYGYPTADVIVGGSAPVAPVLRIFGPVANPDVSTDSGDRFHVVGLNIEADHMLVVDMANGTALIDGGEDASVYHLVDWSVSSFWRLRPGPNTIRLAATTGRLHVQWRERRFTV